MSIIAKTTGERFAVGFRYTSDRIDSGQTLSSCVVTITPTGLTTVGDPSISGTTVTQTVSGGTSGTEYYMTFKTTLSDSTVYEDEMVVKVT